MNISFKEVPPEEIKWDKEIKKDEENKQTVMKGRFSANGKEYVITVKYSSELSKDSQDQKTHEVLQKEFRSLFKEHSVSTNDLASLAGKSIRFNANKEKPWQVFDEKTKKEETKTNHKEIIEKISLVLSKSFKIEITKKDEKKEEVKEPHRKEELVSETKIELKKVEKTDKEKIEEYLSEEEKKQFKNVENLIVKLDDGNTKLKKFHKAFLSRISKKDKDVFVKIEPELNLHMFAFLGEESEALQLLQRGVEISSKYLIGALCHLARKKDNVEVVDYNNPERSDKEKNYETKLEVKKPQKFLMPFWVKEGHFILYTYDIRENIIKRYDSAPKLTRDTKQHDEKALNTIKELLSSNSKKTKKEIEQLKVQEQKVPGQVNNDCGMHVYKNAQFFVEDEEIPEAEYPDGQENPPIEPNCTDFNRERFNMLMAVLGEDPV